jgi:uncharacterized protein (TIGR03083 family)
MNETPDETTPTTIEPSVTATMRHADWMRAAEHDYALLLDLLAQLDAPAWTRPTDCTGWDVRDMVAHLAGAAQWAARLREMARQARHGRRLLPDADLVDGMNELQVRERTDHTPEQLLDELGEAASRAVRARRRLPAPIRALPMPFGPPLGTKPLGYLYDRILTRDTWLHRVDICRAVDQPLLLTAEHDGRLVADVVEEWADLHAAPFELVLTGPAGGHWRRGEGGESHELDAIEFCRVVSGRAPGHGLLTTRVNF